MTRDDIIRMAKEVDLHERVKDGIGYVVRIPNLEKLERFAALIAAEKDKEIKRLQDMLYELLGELTALRAEKQMRGYIKQLKDSAATSEREKVAAWMRSKSYATGHGDTVEDLLKELEWQVAEREREACAKVCEKMADNIYSNSHEDSQPMPHAVAKFCAAAIRARGEV